MYLFEGDGDERRMVGERWPIVLSLGSVYRLALLTVWLDGQIAIDNARSSVEQLREMVRHGEVACNVPDGALMAHNDLGVWRVSEAQLLGSDDLLTAVEDLIARGRGEPTSAHRCHDAVVAYLADRSEEKRLELRAAYLAVPLHHRRFLLGDMDLNDWPLRVITGETQRWLSPRPEPRPTTAEDQESALRSLEEHSARWS